MSNEVVPRFVAAFRGAPFVTATGLLGLALGAICLGAMIIHGPVVEPEGVLFKAASFDGALGLFVLTLVLVLSVAGLSPWGRRLWSGALVPLVLFGYSVETIQIFRGLDPRFSRVAGPLDQALGGVFFLSALAILVLFVVLMARFFFRSTRGEEGVLVLSLRYASVASLLAFGVGIAMSAFGGPAVAPDGNLLPLHATGFHGMQAVPLVALLVAGSRSPSSEALRAVHAAGLAWIGAALAIGVQSFGGGSVLSPSPATAVALLMLVAWALVCGRAALRRHRLQALAPRPEGAS